MAVNTQACELENSLAESAYAVGHSRQSMTGYRQDTNPDWFLPVPGNPRISEVFCGYLDSLSLDNNLLVLVELKEFSQWYGTSIYAVDKVNGRMYCAVKGGYKLIDEKVLLQPSYGFPTSLGIESLASQPLYMNTLPKSFEMGIPMAESIPMPREGPALFRPIPTPQVCDIL